MSYAISLMIVITAIISEIAYLQQYWSYLSGLELRVQCITLG